MNFDRITSKDNPKIKEIVKLINSSKERNIKGQFVIEGARLCRDALLSGLTIKMLMFTKNALDKYSEYVDPIVKVCDYSFMVEDYVFEKMSDTESTQGVICVCQIPNKEFEINVNEKYIAVENLSNPSNLGAISRTAEALGVKTIMLIGNCCDPYSSKSMRASMGALFRLNVVKLSLEDVADLKNRGIVFCASVIDSEAESVNDVNFSNGSVIIIGNEGNGMSEDLISLCDKRVTIPILGKAESFNAAAAATILLWEFMK